MLTSLCQWCTNSSHCSFEHRPGYQAIWNKEKLKIRQKEYFLWLTGSSRWKYLGEFAFPDLPVYVVDQTKSENDKRWDKIWRAEHSIFVKEMPESRGMAKSFNSFSRDRGFELTFRPMTNIASRDRPALCDSRHEAKEITWCGDIERKNQGYTARSVYQCSFQWVLCE